jgi:DNA repair protein RadC
MNQQRDRLDMVNEVLEECILAYPLSSFIISLYKQYQQRGSLSKKQLEGLYGKASKIEGLPPGKLAAIEAIIKRMPTRYKSELPEAKPLFQKEETTGALIAEILEKFPAHKRVLFLKAKYENNELISSADMNDLKRIKALIK